MKPEVARELAEEAIRDDYSERPLVDRVAAAILAGAELQAEETAPRDGPR